MVGMNVGIDHVVNVHPVLLSLLEIEFGVANRVAHGAQTSAPSAEQIGHSNRWRCMEKLTQDHLNPLSTQS